MLSFHVVNVQYDMADRVYNKHPPSRLQDGYCVGDYPLRRKDMKKKTVGLGWGLGVGWLLAEVLGGRKLEA